MKTFYEDQINFKNINTGTHSNPARKRGFFISGRHGLVVYLFYQGKQFFIKLFQAFGHRSFIVINNGHRFVVFGKQEGIDQVQRPMPQPRKAVVRPQPKKFTPKPRRALPR